MLTTLSIGPRIHAFIIATCYVNSSFIVRNVPFFLCVFHYVMFMEFFFSWSTREKVFQTPDS